MPSLLRRAPRLEGPRGTIPFERDDWGYPRVEARDREEATWALGWFHAFDRRAQVTVLLLAARGRLLEHLGDVPAARSVDRSIRALGLARDAHHQVSMLDAETRRLGEIYCAGFDAGARAAGVPVIARALRVPDAPYRPEDVVALYRLTGWFGLNSLTQANALALTRLVAEGASPEDLRALWGDAAAGKLSDELASALFRVVLPDSLTAQFSFAPGGSNAFAVAAARSTTGHAQLMGEFHMEVGRLPPVMYAYSARFPDGEFMHGLTIPGLPAIASGRTRRAAWSYTFGHGANVDVWIERCEAGHQLVRGGRRPLTRRVEEVRVRGRAKPEYWTYWDGLRGTIHGDAERAGHYVGLRWRGLDSTYRDFHANRRLQAASGVDELVAAHADTHTLSLAGVFADAEGRIGRCHSGRVRVGADGLLPRYGPDFEADEPDAPESARPRRLDPEEGFVASANESFAGHTAYAEPRYRRERLDTLLAALPRVSPEDLLRISYDEACGMGKRLAPALAALHEDPELQTLARWAEGQTGRASASDRESLERMHALHHHLLAGHLRRRFGGATATWMLANPAVPLASHERVDALFAGEDPAAMSTEERRALLREALAAIKGRTLVPGVDGPVRLVGPFVDAYTRGGAVGQRLGLDTVPVAWPGGPTSPFQTRLSIVQGMEIQTGPAFHLLIDMGQTTSRYNIAGPASEAWRPRPPLPTRAAAAGGQVPTGEDPRARSLRAWVTAELVSLG